MSNKFEQLLDYIVNEEMDKANELFHEIVVEKSREIYENLISEEEEDESATEESRDEDNDSVEEETEEDEDSVAENMMDGMGMHDMEEETTMEIGGDSGDDMVDDTIDTDAMGMGDEEGDMDSMGGEESMSDEEQTDAIHDLEDALEELKAEFEALLADEKGEEEHDDMFGDEEDDEEDVSDMGDEEDDEEDEEDETESRMPMESRRMTREYTEKVSDGHGAEKKGGAEASGGNTQSPVSKATKKVSVDVSPNNIAQGGEGADSKPGVGGLVKKGGEFVKSGTQNVGGTKAKGYNEKVAKGHGAEKKGSGETQVNDKSIISGK